MRPGLHILREVELGVEPGELAAVFVSLQHYYVCGTAGLTRDPTRLCGPQGALLGRWRSYWELSRSGGKRVNGGPAPRQRARYRVPSSGSQPV